MWGRMRLVKTESVGGGVQTTDACGNADMCSLSGFCPSLSAHTDVLETLNLVLLPGCIYFLTMSGRCTDFSTLWGLVKTFWGTVVVFKKKKKKGTFRSLLFWNQPFISATVNNVQYNALFKNHDCVNYQHVSMDLQGAYEWFRGEVDFQIFL